MKTYSFKVDIELEEGRWVANVPALPGCIVEGDTQAEALQALRDATQAYLEVMIEDGDSLPLGAETDVATGDRPDVVAVTV